MKTFDNSGKQIGQDRRSHVQGQVGDVCMKFAISQRSRCATAAPGR